MYEHSCGYIGRLADLFIARDRYVERLEYLLAQLGGLAVLRTIEYLQYWSPLVVPLKATASM